MNEERRLWVHWIRLCLGIRRCPTHPLQATLAPCPLQSPATHNLVQCMVRWPHISSRIILAPWWLSTTARAVKSSAGIEARGSRRG